MSEMISNSCEKQKELIIAEIKSFTDDICLSSENKLFLTVKLVELCHEALCRERQKKGHGWICATGLERRIDRAAHRLYRLLSDPDVIVLSFETGLLKDDNLYTGLKQKYDLGEDVKSKAYKLLLQNTPRPFFHTRLTDF